MFKRSALALIALAATSALPAHAATAYYGIVGAGRSTIDVDPAVVDRFAIGNGLVTSSTSTTTKDTGWKLQLGMTITETYAIEVGYMNLGHSRFTNINDVNTMTGEKRADLFNVDLVGKIPFGTSFSLLGRIGAYRWETESVLPTPAGNTSRTDNGFDWKFGVGLQYDFTKQLGLRGSYDRFNGIGSTTTTGDSKANLLSLDAVLKF